MKIPTERSRSWGLRSNPWLLIGEVREVCICLHSHLGSMHFGALQGDSIVLTLMGKLNMIFVLIWYMTSSAWWLPDLQRQQQKAERLVSKWQNDCLFDMIYDYPFDRATVSLRPQVIKKLLPGEAKKVAYVKAYSTICKALKYKTRLNQL